MRRLGLSAALLLCGLVLVLVDLAAWIPIGVGPSFALAQTLPPRPTPQPTAKPQESNHSATPVPTGRITGTVIDLTSGAPVRGIGVAVGDVVVTSDANGNYDRIGLTPGRYMVALTLTANQGIAAQEPIAVDLDAGATRVQHLFFRSQPVVSAAPASATATPAELPRTGRTAPGEWRWMWLGIVVIMLGAAIRIGAAGRHSAKP